MSPHTDYNPDNDVTRFTKQRFSKCDFLDDSNLLGGSGAAIPAALLHQPVQMAGGVFSTIAVDLR